MHRNSKKILFVSHESSLYGAPRSLFSIVKAFKKYTPCVVATFGKGGLVSLLESEGVRTTVLKYVTKHGHSGLAKLFFHMINIFVTPINLFQLIRIIHNEKIDIVYVNTVAKSSPVLAGKITGRPVVVHVREGSEFFLNRKSLSKKIAVVLIVRFADMFICISRSTRDLLSAVSPPKAAMHVIYNGVNVADFKRDPQQGSMVRKINGIPQEAIVVGFVGNLSHLKGFDIFLKTAMSLYSHKNLYFMVVGGKSQDIIKYESMISDHPCKKKIRFMGFKTDVKPYFSAMNIFTLTSRAEAFGRVLVEAACMECSIIASRVGGVPEILSHKKSALLIPPDSVSDLSSAIQRIIEDPSLAKRLIKTAKKTVEENFTDETCNKKIEKVISDFVL